MTVDYDGAVARKPRLLLVENDVSLRRSLQLLLRGHGYDVDAYAGPEAILEHASLCDAACLVIDYCLGEASGIATLQALRRRGWDCPAILITAFATHSLYDGAKAAGFAELLEKPFRDHALVNAIRRATHHEHRL